MKHVLIFISFVFFISGCNFLIKKAYRIRSPKLETKESIERYIGKRIKPIVSFPNYMVDSMALKSSKITIPILEIYNKKGHLIITENQKCNFSILYNAMNSTTSDTLQSINKIKSYYPLLGTSAFEHTSQYGYDYYFLVYWTIWSGKVSTNLINAVIKFYQEHPDVKLQIFFVNADFRKEWKWAYKYVE